VWVLVSSQTQITHSGAGWANRAACASDLVQTTVNEISVDERLPTVFKPTSPPPYLNGGPPGYFSWVIACNAAHFPPDSVAKWLESRLPQPLDDESKWPQNS
jgi:hypothetical protein